MSREGVNSEPEDSYDPTLVFPEGELDLRSGADACYKCTSCDMSCPVAAVDDEFPGPKFQGPEQWRLTRKADVVIDDSITSCSNCMRCDDVCPSGVPLSAMHNEARGRYVDSSMRTLSRRYIRNRLLANYGRLGRIASRFPRLSNAAAHSNVLRWLGERLLGITKERRVPEFAPETFRSWWSDRDGSSEARARADTGESKQIAYFHGCYSNYNTPDVAKATVRVFEHFGYEVVVPEQRCSGTPMFANGMLDDASRASETNVDSLSRAIEGGADVVASCTSCSMSLTKEYPELFDHDGIETVARHTFDALEYLRIHEDLESELADSDLDHPPIAYHAPCHARKQGLHRQALELFGDLDGVTIQDVGDSCSGISGTYGWKSEKYDVSMAIGEEMFDHMRDAPGTTGLTECPTCAMQMEHGTGYEIRHPMELLESALVD